MSQIRYGYPGEGAIEYARELTEGLNREEAVEVIHKLLNGPMPDDPRIKRCICCGYPFRDRTRPGNALVCGASCKTAVKTVQRRIQRTGSATPVRRRPKGYIWWLEYPFFLSEKAMFNYSRSYERPHAPEKMAQIMAAKQRYDMMGGRRKPRRTLSE